MRCGAGYYLPYVLVAFFDIFCSTNHQLMNTIYLCFLSGQRDGRLSTNTQALRLEMKAVNSPVAALFQQRSPASEKFQPPCPRSACRRNVHLPELQTWFPGAPIFVPTSVICSRTHLTSSTRLFISLSSLWFSCSNWTATQK